MKRPQIDVTTCRYMTVNKPNALNYLYSTSRDEEQDCRVADCADDHEDDSKVCFQSRRVYAASAFGLKWFQSPYALELMSPG